MINIIALTGKAGSGKTTAAKYIVEKYEYKRLRFADKLKQMMYVLGLSHEEVDGHLKHEPCKFLGGKTPRHAMQTLGTEWGRELITPDLWVHALDRELQKYIWVEAEEKFVIDDLRFVNEAAYLDTLKKDDYSKEYKVLIVSIERGDQKDTGSHVSETQMNNITPDHMLFNHYDLDTLYKSIDEVVEMYSMR
jgi:Cdc6-like AAA superfamily ATPase